MIYAMCASVCNIQAVDYNWNGSAGDMNFSTPDNWGSGLDATIFNNNNRFYIGNSNGMIYLNDLGAEGSPAALNGLYIGSGGGVNGSLTIQAGANIAITGHEFSIGLGGGTGSLYITGGSLTLDKSTYFSNNNGSLGYGKFSGGTVINNEHFHVGTHQSATLDITGDHVFTSTGAFYLGYGGWTIDATVNQSGGRVIASGDGIKVGRYNDAVQTGTYNLTGGELNVNKFWAAANSLATSKLNISQANAGVATLATIDTLSVRTDLNGGTLSVKNLTSKLNHTSGTFSPGEVGTIGTTTINAGGEYTATIALDYSKNYARGGSASQSSYWDDDSNTFAARFAVDGDLSTRAHTKESPVQW